MPSAGDFALMAFQADLLLFFCGMPSVTGWVIDKLGL